MACSVRKFADDCVLDSVIPALMNQFVRVDHCFNLFCAQSRVMVHAIHPRRPQKGTQAMFKTGQQLICEWVRFVHVTHY
jgi:hypothetical protein